MVLTQKALYRFAVGEDNGANTQRCRNFCHKAAKFPRTGTIYTAGQLKTWVPKLYTPAGSAFVAIKVNNARYPMSIKLRDGAHIKNRFREALLGNAAFD